MLQCLMRCWTILVFLGAGTALAQPAGGRTAPSERGAVRIGVPMLKPIERTQPRIEKSPSTKVQTAVTTLPLQPGAVKLLPPEQLFGNKAKFAPRKRPSATTLVRVPISLGNRRPDELKISGGKLQQRPDGVSVAELEAGQQMIVAPKEDVHEAAAPSAQALRPRTRTVLSGLVVRADQGALSPSVSRVFAEVEGMPEWRSEDRVYEVRLLIGLQPEGDVRRAPGPLPSPIALRFRAPTARFVPESINLEADGVAGYRTVAIRYPAFEGTKQLLAIDIIGDMGINQRQIEVWRRLAALRLKPAAEVIAGLGLGSTLVHVERIAEDGNALPDLAPLSVPLSNSLGVPLKTPLDIPGQAGQATFEFRSSGLGMVRLEAGTGLWKAEAAFVKMAVPYWQVLAVLLGGILGGVIHMLRARPYRRALIIEGVLVSMVVLPVLVFIPGLVTLAGAALSAEAGMFGTAALAGFVGIPLLDKLAVKVFPTLLSTDDKASKPQ